MKEKEFNESMKSRKRRAGLNSSLLFYFEKQNSRDSFKEE